MGNLLVTQRIVDGNVHLRLIKALLVGQLRAGAAKQRIMVNAVVHYGSNNSFSLQGPNKCQAMLYVHSE